MRKRFFAVVAMAALVLGGAAWGSDAAHGVTTVSGGGGATDWAHSDGSTETLDITPPASGITLTTGNRYAVYNATDDNVTTAVVLGAVSITDATLAIGDNLGIGATRDVGAGTLAVSVTTLGVVDSTAVFTATNGSTVTVSGAVSGAGTINARNGSTINFGSNVAAGAFSITGGSVVSTGSAYTFASTGAITIDGSTFTGTSTGALTAGTGLTIRNGSEASFGGTVTATAGDIAISNSTGTGVTFGNAVTAADNIVITNSEVTTTTGAFAATAGAITIDHSNFVGNSTGAVTAGTGLTIRNGSEASFGGTVTATAGDIAISNSTGTGVTFSNAVTAADNIVITNSEVTTAAGAFASTAGAITIDGSTFNGGSTGAVTANTDLTIRGNSTASFGGAVTATTGKIDIQAGSTGTFAGTVTGGVTDGIDVAGTFKTATGATLGSDMTVRDTGVLYISENSTAAVSLDVNSKDIAFESGAKLVLDQTIADNAAGTALTNAGSITDLSAIITASNVAGAFRQITFTNNSGTIEFNQSTTLAPATVAANTAGILAEGHGSDFFEDQGGSALSAAIAETGLQAWNGTLASGSLAENFHSSVVSYLQNGSPIGPNEIMFAPAMGSREGAALINGYSGKTYTQGVDAVLRNVSVATLKITSTGSAGRFGTILDQFRVAQGADSFSGGRALASVPSDCLNSYANRFWLGGYGLWEDAGARRGNLGYEYNSGGFILGYDHVFANSIAVGGAFAYGRGEFEDKAALANDSDIDSASFQLYALYRNPTGFFASLSGGYTNSSQDMKTLHLANAAWENADYNAHTWNFGGKVGYDWKYGCFSLTPSIGLYHYNSRSSKFNTNLRNDVKVTGNQTELPLDLAFRYEGPVGGDARVRVGANVGYAYNFNARDKAKATFTFAGVANSPVVATQGRDNGHGVWNVGAGAGFSAGRFDFDVKYDYYRRAKTDAHQVYGTIGINF